MLVLMLVALSTVNAEKLADRENLNITNLEALALIEGLFEGAFGNEGRAAVEWIENAQIIFHLIEQSIGEFKAGGFQNIVQGLIHVGTALQELPQEFKDCTEAEKIIYDVEKILFEFLNPEALIVEVGKAIVWHGFQIYGDVKDAIHNFDTKNYRGAGRNIGDIVNLLFVRFYSKAGPAQEVADTVEGLLTGAFGAEGKGAAVCLQDGEVIFLDIANAIKDFEKGGVTNIIAGLYNIGLALEELPEEFKECEAAEPILVDIEKIAAEFKNPKELAIHVGTEVLWHGKDIYGDITGATTDFKDGKFEPAGEMIGDIIKILLVETAKELIKISA